MVAEQTETETSLRTQATQLQDSLTCAKTDVDGLLAKIGTYPLPSHTSIKYPTTDSPSSDRLAYVQGVTARSCRAVWPTRGPSTTRALPASRRCSSSSAPCTTTRRPPPHRYHYTAPTPLKHQPIHDLHHPMCPHAVPTSVCVCRIGDGCAVVLRGRGGSAQRGRGARAQAGDRRHGTRGRTHGTESRQGHVCHARQPHGAGT